MSSFFHPQAQIMMAKHIGSYSLLKINQLPDWLHVEQLPSRQKTRCIRDHRGCPAYPLLPMLKAVLLGQWYSLSDPELECYLANRLDFYFFCGFDDAALPDHSTLCRFRNWLAQDDTLAQLMALINRQLTKKGLKVEKAQVAVIDATIIQTASGKQRQAIEADKSRAICGETTPSKNQSKNQNARWIKKNDKFKLGYKQHTRTDSDGYIEKLHITPANTHECNHFDPLLESIVSGATVYAEKGYDSKTNREHLQSKQLSDGIMCKAHRGKPLTEQEKQRNIQLSKMRYVVEQTFGTLHRKFGCKRARYFGLRKVLARSHLKAVCLNLLKAANRLRAPTAA